MKAACTKCGSEGVTDRIQGVCPACLFGQLTTEDAVGPLETGSEFMGLEIVEKLGQGGMGVVYKARQPQLNRFVALKILSPALAVDPDFRQRFVLEAQALAKMNHPNIVAVHDFGEREGLYFLVMEFVEGANLRHVLDSGLLTSDEILKLVPALCEAIEYAHTQGIVHRDIKPENILIDRTGRVKITDFGLAKIANPVKKITKVGIVMGTPQYMAPEQMESLDAVDHRADLYSLGAVIYEILTGKVPAAKFVRPSRLAKTDPRFDRLLERTLHRDPACRHVTAKDIAKEVTVIINSPPPSHVPWRLIGAGGFGIVLIALMLFAYSRDSKKQVTSVSTAPQDAGNNIDKLLADLSGEALETREAAQMELLKVAAADRAVESRLNAERGRAKDAELCARLDKILGDIEYVRAKQVRIVDEGRIDVSVPGTPGALAISPDGKYLASAGPDERIALLQCEDLQELRLVSRTKGEAWCATFSPNGQWLATVEDTSVILRDVKTGQEVTTFKHEKPVRKILFSRDGGRLFSVSFGRIHVWDVGKSSQERLLQDEQVGDITLSADGSFLVAQRSNYQITRWDLSSWERAPLTEEVRTNVETGMLGVLAVNGDGSRVAEARMIHLLGHDTGLYIWDARGGGLVRHIRDIALPHHLLTTPDGKHLICETLNEISVLDWETLDTQSSHKKPNEVQDWTITPDGKYLFLAGGGEVVKMDVASGKTVGRAVPHRAGPHRIALHPDGKTLITVGHDAMIRLMDLGERKEIGAFKAGEPPLYILATNPDGSQVAVGSGINKLWVWDLRSRENVRTLRIPGQIAGLYLTAQGNLVTVDFRGPISVDRVREGETTREFGTKGGYIFQTALSADGRLVARCGLMQDADRNIWRLDVWDTTTGSSVFRITPPEEPDQIAFAHDASRLFFATKKGELKAVRIPSGVIEKASACGEGVRRVLVDPAGRYLALVLNDKFKLFHAASLLEVLTQTIPVPDEITFSSNGNLLAIRNGATIHLLSVESATPK